MPLLPYRRKSSFRPSSALSPGVAAGAGDGSSELSSKELSPTSLASFPPTSSSFSTASSKSENECQQTFPQFSRLPWELQVHIARYAVESPVPIVIGRRVARAIAVKQQQQQPLQQRQRQRQRQQHRVRKGHSALVARATEGMSRGAAAMMQTCRAMHDPDGEVARHYFRTNSFELGYYHGMSKFFATTDIVPDNEDDDDDGVKDEGSRKGKTDDPSGSSEGRRRGSSPTSDSNAEARTDLENATASSRSSPQWQNQQQQQQQQQQLLRRRQQRGPYFQSPAHARVRHVVVDALRILLTLPTAVALPTHHQGVVGVGAGWCYPAVGHMANMPSLQTVTVRLRRLTPWNHALESALGAIIRECEGLEKIRLMVETETDAEVAATMMLGGGSPSSSLSSSSSASSTSGLNGLGSEAGTGPGTPEDDRSISEMDALAVAVNGSGGGGGGGGSFGVYGGHDGRIGPEPEAGGEQCLLTDPVLLAFKAQVEAKLTPELVWPDGADGRRKKMPGFEFGHMKLCMFPPEALSPWEKKKKKNKGKKKLSSPAMAMIWNWTRKGLQGDRRRNTSRW